VPKTNSKSHILQNRRRTMATRVRKKTLAKGEGKRKAEKTRENALGAGEKVQRKHKEENSATGHASAHFRL